MARIFILITPILAILFPIIEIPVTFNKPSISLENTNFYQVLSTQTAPEEIAGSFGLPEITVSSTRLPLLWEITDYLFLGYLLIVLILISRLIWQFHQLQALFRKGWYQTVYNLKDNYLKVPTFGLAPIFSYFDKLFWDDTLQLSEAEKNQIIKHELEHMRQGHSFDILFYQILSILFWFNPAIHLMRSALVDTHEYLADERVIHQIKDREHYKKLIIKIAFKGLDLPIGNYFIRSTTLKRILMMKKSPRINWLKLLMIFPLTAMLLALVSMKTSQPLFHTESHSNVSVSELERNLLLAKDTLEVGIKVVKVKEPEHYELIGPLQDQTVTALIGSLQYTFTNVSSEEEYIKVLGMIDHLRAHTSTSKTYVDILFPPQLDEKAQPEDEEAWNRFLEQIFTMPEREKRLKLSRDIIVEFVVDQDGRITKPTIKRSFGGGLDQKVLEALVSEDAPTWTPAQKDGKRVASVTSIERRIVSSGVRSDSHAFFPTPSPDRPSIRRVDPAVGDVFDVVQEPPVPQGGMEGWTEYLSQNLKYPERAKEQGIEGTVYVAFIVTREGEIINPDILRGIGGGADEEALRVIKDAPRWTPGRQRGQEVNVKMRLPIRFSLDKKETHGKISPREPGIYEVTDVPPTPKGGMDAWNNYFMRNIQYPESARNQNIEGIVYVTFIVNKEGQVKDPDILRGIGGGADEEALRLLKNAPAWEPGKVDGEPVNARMRLPIRFRIAGSDKPREKVVGEGHDHTLSEIVVTAYGTPAKTHDFLVHIQEDGQISYQGKTYTYGEFDRHLGQLIANNTLTPHKVQAQLSASPELKVGKLKDFEKLLMRHQINKLVYRDPVPEPTAVTFNLSHKPLQDGKKPLFLIDGQVSSQEQLSQLNPNDIEKITAVKPEEAVGRYGKAAIHGAVLIVLKQKED